MSAASTGGFTDCLLQRGAARVHAVDVGAGQLDWKLRNDPRVVVHEGINARYLRSEDIGEPVDLASCDVSFISVTLILPAVAPILRPEGEMVILVKPQFEVGKGQVGKGGIVRAPELHREACERVESAVKQPGLRNEHHRESHPRRGRQPGVPPLCPTLRPSASSPSPSVPAAAELVPKLIAWLAERGIAVRCDEETAAYAGTRDGMPRDEVPEGADLVIVLGGDGTLLSAARAIGGREIPLFPVNLGGLGFLTAITMDEIYPELERAFRGEHRIGKRKLLHAELLRGEKPRGQLRSAQRRGDHQIRDRAHDRSGYACRPDVRLPLQGRRADCGDAHRLHGLFAVGGRSHHFPLRGRDLPDADLPAHADQPAGDRARHQRDPDHRARRKTIRRFSPSTGRSASRCSKGDQIVCRSSSYTLMLIRPPRMLFFDVLRQKLKWGER